MTHELAIVKAKCKGKGKGEGKGDSQMQRQKRWRKTNADPYGMTTKKTCNGNSI